MALRINVGCGRAPTEGWRNFDNSTSLRLARIPFLPGLLLKLGILESAQYQFVRFAREKKIEYGDATRGLPVGDDSVDVLYSSHLLEHLDRSEADAFLDEAFRIIRPGGVIRLAVPDIRQRVDKYIRTNDADAFIKSTQLCVPRARTLGQRLRLFLVGNRHHQWMYDGRSLARLIEKHGFVRAEVMPGGDTKIGDRGSLDLHEREADSVYVEAEKPGA